MDVATCRQRLPLATKADKQGGSPGVTVVAAVMMRNDAPMKLPVCMSHCSSTRLALASAAALDAAAAAAESAAEIVRALCVVSRPVSIKSANEPRGSVTSEEFADWPACGVVIRAVLARLENKTHRSLLV